MLKKGRKIYVEGRLQTRTWTGQDGTQRSTTEVVISDMIMLDSKRDAGAEVEDFDIPDDAIQDAPDIASEPSTPKKVKAKDTKAEEVSDAADEDIPF